MEPEQKLYIIKKWSTPLNMGQSLIDGVSEEQIPSFVAALEGQRVFNETIIDDSETAQFKRISIPLVRRLLAAAPNLEGSFDKCRYWHLLHVKWFPYVPIGETHRQLDHEAEYTVKLTEDMAEEIKKLGPTKFYCIRREGDQLLINCENA